MSIFSKAGLTLMSVMAAVALTGIVSIAVAKLIGLQSKAVHTLKLREERENLIKYYRGVILAGWDETLKAGGCSGDILDRASGDVRIPAGGITVDSSNLYSSTTMSTGWWRITATPEITQTSKIYESDKWDKSTGDGLLEDSYCVRKLQVEFLRDRHPTVKHDLTPREEFMFMHHDDQLLVNNDCRDPSNKTRNDYSIAGAVDKAVPLYSTHESGAVVQYDFNTDYVKCSQVPLIQASECPDSGSDPKDMEYNRKCLGAITGFWPDRSNNTSGYSGMHKNFRDRGDIFCNAPNLPTRGLGRECITGQSVCSMGQHPYHSANFYVHRHQNLAVGGDVQFMTLKKTCAGNNAGGCADEPSETDYDKCQVAGASQTDCRGKSYISWIDLNGVSICQDSTFSALEQVECASKSFAACGESPASTVQVDVTTANTPCKTCTHAPEMQATYGNGFQAFDCDHPKWVPGRGGLESFRGFGGSPNAPGRYEGDVLSGGAKCVLPGVSTTDKGYTWPNAGNCQFLN